MIQSRSRLGEDLEAQDNMKIIGLTGSFASGKDAVADFLVKRGFFYYSLSDLLRRELAKEGKSEDRDNLIERGNESREKFGADILAQRIVEQIKKDEVEKAVVVSVRNPEEVNFLKAHSDFELWFVDAPLQARFARAKKRMRPEDEVSLEKFIEQENRENSEDPNHQQLGKVRSLADKTIENDADEEALRKKTARLLEF